MFESDNTYRDRFKDKFDFAVVTIAKFGFTTRKLLSALFDVSAQGNWQFFKKLESSGLISANPVLGSRTKVYMLTKSGFEYAKYLLPSSNLVYRKTLSLPYLNHSLNIQQFVVEKREVIKSFLSESELIPMSLSRQPDLLATMKNNQVIAVEMELTQKNAARIQYNYASAFRDIERGFYHNVIYVFTDANVLRFYKSIYSQEVWNTYQIQVDKKLRQVGNFSPVELKQRYGDFIFNLQNPYKLG
ncbi:hypothetical protein PU006_004574 [Salmonella enterica]|nr:hypothetical protein [Salmonella enterica]